MSASQEIPFLKPITFTVDITTEIIRRCEIKLQNDEEYMKLKSDGLDFKMVIPYGNPEDPCFQVNQVFKFELNAEANQYINSLYSKFALNKAA